MLLWLVPALALAAPEAPQIRLLLEPGLSCDLNATLGGALGAQQVRLAEASDASAWTLTVKNRGPTLEFQLLNPLGVLRGERRLSPTTADCGALPRTVALLVKAWVGTQLQGAPEPAAAPAGAPAVPGPAEEPRAPVRDRGGESAASALGSGPTPVSSPSEGAPRPPAHVAAPAPSAPALPRQQPPGFPTHPPHPEAALETPAAKSEAPAPDLTAVPPAAEFFTEGITGLRPRDQTTVSAMIRGGGGVDGAAVVGLGALSVEWGFLEPWGVALDVGLQSPRSHGVPLGSASVQLQWAALSVRRGFFTHGVDGFHLGLGVQGVWLSAGATGFTTHEHRDVFLPAAEAALDWRVTASSGLFLFVRLSVQGRLRPEEFKIAGLDGALVTVPAWGAALELGAGWNFL